MASAEASDDIGQLNSALSKPTPGNKPKSTRRLDANEDNHGSHDTIGSFLVCYKSEPKCAAYLGYTDVGEFRKFEFSFLVLEFYNTWGKFCTGKSSIVPLELVRDLQNPDEDFPEDPLDAAERYGPDVALKNPVSKDVHRERDNNANYLMASLIYRLAQRLEKGLAGLSVVEMQTRQVKASQEFEALTNHSLLPVDCDNLILPKLGPHIDLGEVELEKYNRVLNLLRSISHTTSGCRWNEKMTVDPFCTRTLHPSSLPRWMVQQKIRADTASKPPAFPTKDIYLVHNIEQKTKHSDSLQAHITDYIEMEGLSMPKIKQYPAKDPRYFNSGEQWRDTVRRQLNMQNLRIELFTMHLEFTDEEPDLTTKVTVFGPAKPLPWSEVKGILLQTDLEVQFLYTIRPLEVDEDYEPEYHGVPISLAADFRVGEDGDIERVAALPHQSTIDEEEAMENSAFLSGGGTTVKRPPVPQSEYSVNDRAIMLEQHNTYDVFTSQGLRDWQFHVIENVAGTQPKLSNDLGFKGSKQVSASQRKELRELRAAGESLALSIDAEAMDVDGRYYSIQAAFTGADTQTGPMVEPSKVVLGMETVGKHGQSAILDQNKCTTLPRCKATFLDSQATGATFMLQRSYGFVPVDSVRATDPEVAKARESLNSVKTGGGYLVDVTGFGKTDTACLFASQHALYGEHGNGHRPTLIVVPNGAVFSQWQGKIYEKFSDLTLIVSNDDKPSEAKYLQSWVSSTAMREAPEKLNNWPADLKYVFNPNDPRASKVVILTPYDSHSARTVGIEWVHKTSEAFGSAMALPNTKTKSKKTMRAEMRSREGYADCEPVFVSKWKGIFGMVILDEGHKVRHAVTKVHASILLLDASIHWFLTATPIINSAYDMLGGLHILWPQAKRALMADQEAVSWLRVQSKQNYRIFDELDALPAHDIRRTITMDPKRIQALLDTRDVSIISAYYHYLDELIAVRRSPASELVRNEKGEKVSLKSMMPKHVVKTVELSYDDEEELEAQCFHRVYAREYVDALAGALGQGEVTKLGVQLSMIGPDTKKDRKSPFPPITGPSRRLAITAKSTKLARFDEAMRKIGMNTLVKDMEGYRTKGHNVDWLVEMTRRDGDWDPSTRLEKIQFLSEGSPTLRFILSQVKDTVLFGEADPDGHPNKLIITEDTPLTAWFWEIVLNYLYIETEALHSGMTNSERVDLVKRFNDPNSSLKILVLMYNVGAQGVNLDQSCKRVLVATGALNASLEIQAWGRAIRVSQRYEVMVIRCKTLNSNDQYRDARQMDKAMMDMATRSWSPSIRKLLVDLLNEGNTEVAEAHASAAGKKLLEDVQSSNADITNNPLTLEVQDGQLLAKTVPENDDLDVDAAWMMANDATINSLRRSGRTRRQPGTIWADPNFREGFDEYSPETTESSEESSEDIGSDYGDSGSDGDDDDLDTEAEEEFAIGGYVPEDEWVTDEDGGIRLQSRTTKTIRQNYSRLSRKEKEAFDQDNIVLRQLLSLDSKRVYTEEDLNNEDIHDRALRLLYRARFGQDNEYTRIAPHIRYDKLRKETIQQINKSIKMSDETISYLRAMAADGKTGKETKRARPGISGVKKDGRGKKKNDGDSGDTLEEGTVEGAKRKRKGRKANGRVQKKGKNTPKCAEKHLQFKSVLHNKSPLLVKIKFDVASLSPHLATIRTFCIPLHEGGIWINLGPLLWHFAERAAEDVPADQKEDSSMAEEQTRGIAEPGSFELCNDELLMLVEKMGFGIEHHEIRRDDTGYIQNPESMLQNMYRNSYWVAKKRALP